METHRWVVSFCISASVAWCKPLGRSDSAISGGRGGIGVDVAGTLMVLVALVEVGWAGFTEASGCAVRVTCVVGMVGCGGCWCSPNKPMMNATIVAKILKIMSLSSLASSVG